jgi:hypothetical protein
MPQGLVRPEGLGKLKKKKIRLPHWVSNSQPSGLYHVALTTSMPSVANVYTVMKATV